MMTAVARMRPGTGPDVETAVLDRARRGDHEAFAIVVRHYDPALRALAYRLLGSRERMDDALQEAYVKAFRALPGFSGRSRGLDRFVVTTRLAGDGRWSDPLASGEGFVDHPEGVNRRRRSARHGRRARAVAARRAARVVRRGGLVVTVAGDLSRAELVSVAASLQPAG